MTITLVKGTGESAVTTTLCAGRARNTTGSPIGPEGLSGSDMPGVVTRDYIGAEREHPELVRCNHGSVSFSVTRTFANVDAAEEYMASTFLDEGSEGALYYGSRKVYDY
ncbi:MAG: hypothetical protein IIW14_01765, partial [Kiritimatiellae bacterium]|nr:hypothetical protein [Kiritimatiellia bacterium]